MNIFIGLIKLKKSQFYRDRKLELALTLQN